MCLSTVWPKKKQKEWLKKKKSPLIVYGVANKRANGCYYPAFWNADRPYKLGLNELPERKRKVNAWTLGGGRYLPYFHRFITLKSAKNWRLWGTYLRWRCYKKDITDIGTQRGSVVIIARKLTLLGEVK